MAEMAAEVAAEVADEAAAEVAAGGGRGVEGAEGARARGAGDALIGRASTPLAAEEPDSIGTSMRCPLCNAAFASGDDPEANARLNAHLDVCLNAGALNGDGGGAAGPLSAPASSSRAAAGDVSERAARQATTAKRPRPGTSSSRGGKERASGSKRGGQRGGAPSQGQIQGQRSLGELWDVAG